MFVSCFVFRQFLTAQKRNIFSKFARGVAFVCLLFLSLVLFKRMEKIKKKLLLFFKKTEKAFFFFEKAMKVLS